MQPRSSISVRAGLIAVATFLVAVAVVDGADEQPLAEPELADTITVPVGRTPDEIKSAILNALQSHGWKIKEQTESEVMGVIDRRPITVTVTVKYDERTVEVWVAGTGPAATLQRKVPGWTANVVRGISGPLGGATASRRTFREVPPKTKDGAIIYVYRVRSMSGAFGGSLPVFLDGPEVAKLAQNTYSALQVPAGEHCIIVGQASMSLIGMAQQHAQIANGTFTVAPGQSYFLCAKGLSAAVVPREQALREIMPMVERPNFIQRTASQAAAVAKPADPGAAPLAPGEVAPPLAAFTITDPNFQAEGAGTGTDVDIVGVNGTKMDVKVRAIALGDSAMNLWCDRAKHRWIGTLSYHGYTFESSGDDPLQFQAWKGRGYVHVGGTGRVQTPDHRTVELTPAPAPAEASTSVTPPIASPATALPPPPPPAPVPSSAAANEEKRNEAVPSKKPGATLDDVSAMSFAIENCTSPRTIEVTDMFSGRSSTLPQTEGKKFYVVTLVGRLEGLHEKFGFVTKDQKRFLAYHEDGDRKEYSEGVMIMGLFGWQIDGRNWVLAPKEDAADPDWRDKERFTVAFSLPEAWRQFSVAVRHNSGEADLVRAGQIDADKIGAAAAPSEVSRPKAP
jgi:hypothetical protein